MSGCVRSLSRVVVLTVALLLAAMQSWSQDERYWPGEIGFTADHEVLDIPYGISGLIFDTTECPGCQDSLPQWRYLGDLKIDSVMMTGGYRRQGWVESYQSGDQLRNLVVESEELLEILHRYGCRLLKKCFSRFDAADTVSWDSIQSVWFHGPDLSRHFRVVIPHDMVVDSVITELETVAGLRYIHRIPKPIGDVIEEEQ